MACPSTSVSFCGSEFGTKILLQRPREAWLNQFDQQPLRHESLKKRYSENSFDHYWSNIRFGLESKCSIALQQVWRVCSYLETKRNKTLHTNFKYKQHPKFLAGFLTAKDGQAGITKRGGSHTGQVFEATSKGGAVVMAALTVKIRKHLFEFISPKKA